MNILSTTLSYNVPEQIPPVYDEPPRSWPGIKAIVDLPHKFGKMSHPDILLSLIHIFLLGAFFPNNE